MTLHYVDSSAWAKLLVEEPESAALAAWVEDRLGGGEVLASSQLLVTELHRLAHRLGVAPTEVTKALSVVGLALPDESTFRAAGLLPGPLRSLDALHIATALELDAHSLLTYDEGQRDAATAVGLPTCSPG